MLQYIVGASTNNLEELVQCYRAERFPRPCFWDNPDGHIVEKIKSSCDILSLNMSC